MDKVLSQKFKAALDPSGDLDIAFVESTPGTIEWGPPDDRERYDLKPLRDLYGTGNPNAAVDPQNDVYMPLFLSIEEEIARHDRNERELTDADVTFALKAMSQGPEEPSADLLVTDLQLALRLTLSLHDYSRQEVRQAIRRIGRSVERHSQGGRGRGYLTFVQQYVGKGGR